jgi:two-component system, NtrC family, sensor kinase
MSSPQNDLHQMASIGRLLAGIVHEINTPIGAVLSNNEVILRSLDMLDPLLAEPTPANLERARTILATCRTLASVDRLACDQIRSVIRGLKTFSRVDASELKKLDVNTLLRDTLKLTQAEFRKRIAVETDLEDLPAVECFPQMLSQVFLNLLVNAAQAIEGEGRIAVRSRLEGATVCISISDTGRGMTPRQKAQAFQAGFTTKALGEGTGLGLSIAKDIVEDKHGGSIEFDSEPGVGTTFRIRIPVQHTRRVEQ